MKELNVCSKTVRVFSGFLMKGEAVLCSVMSDTGKIGKGHFISRELGFFVDY